MGLHLLDSPPKKTKKTDDFTQKHTMCLTFSGSGNESHPKAIRLKRIRRPKVARTRIPRRGKLRGGGWYGKVPVMVTFPNLDAYYGYDSTRSMRFGLPTSYVGSC